MTRAAPYLAAVAAVVVALLAGLWFWAGVVAPGYTSAIVLAVAWCAAVSVAAGRAGKRLPRLRRTLRATSLTCAALLLAGGWWTSVRETTVDEMVVEGVPASSLDREQLERDVGGDPLAPQP